MNQLFSVAILATYSSAISLTSSAAEEWWQRWWRVEYVNTSESKQLNPCHNPWNYDPDFGGLEDRYACPEEPNQYDKGLFFFDVSRATWCGENPHETNCDYYWFWTWAEIAGIFRNTHGYMADW